MPWLLKGILLQISQIISSIESWKGSPFTAFSTLKRFFYLTANCYKPSSPLCKKLKNRVGLHRPWRFLMSLIWSSRTFCRFRLAKTSSSSCFRSRKMLFSSVCKLFILGEKKKKKQRRKKGSNSRSNSKHFVVQLSIFYTAMPLRRAHFALAVPGFHLTIRGTNTNKTNKIECLQTGPFLAILSWLLNIHGYILPANFCVISFWGKSKWLTSEKYASKIPLSHTADGSVCSIMWWPWKLCSLATELYHLMLHWR